MYWENNVNAQLVSVLCFGVFIVGWILLPLIPAVLTYKIAPGEKIAASGPLSGLTIRVTGAFAAYLIVFLLSFSAFRDGLAIAAAMAKPNWMLSAKIVLRDEKGDPVDASASSIPPVTVTYDPPLSRSYPDRLEIVVPGNADQWPNVVLHIPSFGGKTIYLKDEVKNDAITMSPLRLEARLDDPIIIRRQNLKPIGVGLELQ
jgi:hypothetical protein